MLRAVFAVSQPLRHRCTQRLSKGAMWQCQSRHRVERLEPQLFIAAVSSSQNRVIPIPLQGRKLSGTAQMSAERHLSLHIAHPPCMEDEQHITQGLMKFNAPHFSVNDEKPVACYIRNEKGDLMGGMSAIVIYNNLYIKKFWLSDAVRGMGLGSQLVEAIEAEGRRQCADTLFVDTHTTQAPGFYKKNGFEEVGRLKGFPKPGIDKVFLSKSLRDEGPDEKKEWFT